MTSAISGASGGFNAAALKQMQEQMFKAVDSNGDNKIDKAEMSAFQAAQQSNGTQGGPSVDEIFKNMDSNNDSAISRLESDAAIAKMSQQMQSQGATTQSASEGTGISSASELKDHVFKVADQNGDGSISKDELTKLLSNSSQSSTTADDLMTALDTNKDGSISKSESDAAIDKAGKKRHAQGPPPPPPPADSSSSSSDKTSSSQIFDALDTNKDGTVSASELLAALSGKDSSSSDNSSSDSSSSASGSSADSSAVKKIFDAMDTNQDGSVSKSELEAALSKTGKQHHSKATTYSSSSTSTTDSANSNDSALFAAAAKSYLQASFSSFAQNATTSALSSSAVYA
jgi:Ca2+-binding EF-hand superfamily protein